MSKCQSSIPTVLSYKLQFYNNSYDLDWGLVWYLVRKEKEHIFAHHDTDVDP